MGGLLGFRMGTILASFHNVEIPVFLIEKLNISVKAVFACVPKCFRCKFEVSSGPVEDVFFVLAMALLTICVENGGVMFVFWAMACTRFSVCLS